jgi:hypothetical protein
MKISSFVVPIVLTFGLAAADTLRGSATSEFERMLNEYDYGAQCSSNPVCKALGLTEGVCCPSASGYLDCCNRKCEQHSSCNTLAENCCPTIDNVELACCDHQKKLEEEREKENRNPSVAACSAHPACTHLAGNCCPTQDSVFLDCCTAV